MAAVIFDLNGTMIDDMQYHLKVWYDVLHELGANLSIDQVRNHMYGKNDELLTRIFGESKFTQQEIDKISKHKEDLYQQIYRPHLELLPGLDLFLSQAHAAGIKIAIGSAAIPYNINFVLDNLNIRHYFQAIVSAHDVLMSKPHPEVFLKAAEQLGVDAAHCIVFEDAPKGVEAAHRAGMKSIVITSMHHQNEFMEYDNILQFVPNYLMLSPAELFGKI